MDTHKLEKLDLPILEVINDIKQNLRTNNRLIVNAPPGAGKSTVVPLVFHDEDWLGDKKILLLEPRRLAAKSVAARLADLGNVNLGDEIGYRIRFETRVSENTKIEVVTEGILTRMLQSDNALDNIGLIIFDEFHERSIHADLSLAFALESQMVLRPDLRIMIMSATLDMPKLSKLLECPTVVSQGRQYPVDIKHVGNTDQYLIPEMTSKVIKQAMEQHDGDCLVFLPGQGEILKCQDLLRKSLPGDVRIHPLYGALPFKKQTQAILPDPSGRRKVVLATSIAETSLTIEGIKIVVDSGFGRTQKFDPNSGLSKLETVQISKDSADQRAGRAGRLAPGTCYRMWTQGTHQQMSEHTTPEILDSDLTPLTLELAKWGIKDVGELQWLDQPSSGSIKRSVDLLEKLEALEDGNITEHGIAIHKIPTHPRIAHMLISAEDLDATHLATDLAALLEERDPLQGKAGVDINDRIEALRRFRAQNSEQRHGAFAKIERVAKQYRSIFNLEEDNDSFDYYETGILVAFAYPERIACARPGNNAQFQLANGRFAMAGHKDDLAYQPWLAVANLNARDGMGKIFLAAPLNPKDLASMVKEEEIIVWDTQEDELKASLDLRIGNIILKSTPLPDPDPELKTMAISKAVQKEGDRLLDWTTEVEQWQNRVLSLRIWNPEQQWPDVSTSNLLSTTDKWLVPYLNDVKSSADLKKLNLLEILSYTLDFDLQQSLDKLAPQRIEVPSGSNIKLQYASKGENPILAVRLQEVFGLPDTPTVNEGKNTVLMHLLSPGFKPVQITGDLKNFWDNTYFEVKKDLKGRYPKHHWPDDPWSAEAVRGVKKKNPK